MNACSSKCGVDIKFFFGSLVAMDSSALTSAEQREYLRLVEKMRSQNVIPPMRTQGGMSDASKRAQPDDVGECSALKDSFDKIDAGEWEQVLDGITVGG